MSYINVFLLDNSYNTKEEISIAKPRNYQEFLLKIKQQFRNLPNYFEIFCIDKNNKEIKINSEEKYRTIEDILFIREIENNNLLISVFSKNYNKLSDSKKEKLDDKYGCFICLSIIKHENPYLCYKCQKIFHEKCLKDWDNKCRIENNNFSCPSCRSETPINIWNKKLDYEEKRKEMADLIDKINELKEDKIQQFTLIKKYSKYIEKSFEAFKNILLQLNFIHSMLKLQYNYNLNNLINKFPLNFDNLALNDITNTINYELDQFKINLNSIKNINNSNIKVNAIYNNNINNINNQIPNQKQMIRKKSNIDNNLCTQYVISNKNNNNNRILSAKNNISNKGNSIFNNSLPSYAEIMRNKNIINNNESIRDLGLFKNNINITYSVPTKGYYTIFGGNFVMNNKFNIRLNINGKQNIELVSLYELNKGENNITLIINNQLTNLSEMFNGCKILKDIKDLEFLDISKVQNLSGMFSGCANLVDINPLLNWNVSNCTNFSLMFCGCTYLSNISPLQFWNVSKGNDFSYMFCKCTGLYDIKPLQNWNVSNGNDFTRIFSECPLDDLSPIQKWNVSKELLKYIK